MGRHKSPVLGNDAPMNMPWLSPLIVTCLLIWVVAALVTFGHLFRYGRSGLKRRVVHLGLAVAWPVYWVSVLGLRDSLTTLMTNVTAVLLALIAHSGSVIEAALRELVLRQQTMWWTVYWITALAAFGLYTANGGLACSRFECAIAF